MPNIIQGDYMGKPHKQDSTLEHDIDEDEDDSSSIANHRNLDADDDFTDDWISHVDDFDNSDDVNDW